MSIRLTNVHFNYNDVPALEGINLSLQLNTFTCLIGHTGSGKSTLLQHLNGLLLPNKGQIEFADGIKIEAEKKVMTADLKAIRQKIGLVFQFPEMQLFEETVLKDIMFTPTNFGLSIDEAEALARYAAELVGLPETLLEHSPFELSGGQKRRVAIAGVLAANPDVLLLDEPTAGLDPKSADEMMSIFKKLHEDGKTIVMVTHDMDLVAEYATNVVVLKDGKVLVHDKKEVILTDKNLLKKAGLDLPTPARIYSQIKPEESDLPLTLEEFIDKF